MKVAYYPGCTLKTAAANFETSAVAGLERLGIELEELPRWNCCGTVYSLASDDLIHQLAPIRNLIRVKEQNCDRLTTLCAMCYNTLKRSNFRFQQDPESLETLNRFMYLENLEYQGDVEVLHPLELLRDEIGFAKISKRVVRPLNGLKVANYYGCMLIRPHEIGLDDPENPVVMEQLTEALGAEPVDFPFKTECCGAYQTVEEVALVVSRAYQILTSAQSWGAEMVAVSCPLCAFNLDQRQREVKREHVGFKRIPVMYFTQLLALAMGLGEEVLRLDLHDTDPRPVLKQRQLL